MFRTTEFDPGLRHADRAAVEERRQLPTPSSLREPFVYLDELAWLGAAAAAPRPM